MIDMNAALLWWIAAGVVLGAELLTGTVYLMLLSLGMAAAGVAAHLGVPLSAQLLTCATVGGVGMLLWRWRSRSAATQASPSTGFDLDVGQRVQVTHWTPDHQTSVHYRGAPWQARWQDSTGTNAPPPGPGEFTILAIEGARLVLGNTATPHPPA
jgi:membrane protein implicated in regulation of membrane protease activity